MDNLPVSTAAFRVIRNIEVYRNVDGLKKEWSRLTAQTYAMNEICLSRNKAVTSLLKLQNYGVADDEILTVYEFLNDALNPILQMVVLSTFFPTVLVRS